MKRVIQYITIAFLCLAAAGRLSAQDCACVNCPVPITDNATSSAQINVNVNGANNLAECPLQRVCFRISHTWIGDLAINLTSPNGTSYLVMADTLNNLGGFGCGNPNDNINVCVNTGTDNPLTNNNNYVCNGDPWDCINGEDWTVPCGGVTDPVTGALQAPNCDLNDFNTEGAPANGIWTLTASDICLWNEGFIETFTLEFACGQACFDCEPDGGSIQVDDVTACAGSDDLLINAIPEWTTPEPDASEYAYTFALVQNDIILTVTNNPDLTGAPAGEYQVCGISYHLFDANQLSSLIGTSYSAFQNAPTFCAEFSNNSGTIIIVEQQSPTLVNLQKCAEDCLEYNAVEYCEAGTFPLAYTDIYGCDSLVNLVITDYATQDVTEVELFTCEGDCVDFDNIDYCIEDTYEITYSDVNGCDSTVLLTLTFYETNTPTEVNEQICAGDCTEYAGTEYCAAGIYPVILENALGCDSLVNFTLSFYETNTPTEVSAQVCADDCMEYAGTEYCAAGTYPIVLENALGCDSLVNFTLSFYETNTPTEVNEQVCAGDCTEYAGMEYCAAGTYPVVLENALGCDSLVNFTLSFYETNTPTEVIEQVCAGDCMEYAGTEYCAAGTYPVVLENALGCDSLVNFTLSFYETNTPTEVIEQVCAGDCMEYAGTEYCAAGTYPIVLENVLGCDSLVNFTLSFYETNTPTEVSEQVCAGDCTEYAGTEYCAAGTYPVVLENALGCDSLVNYTLIIFTPEVVASEPGAITCDNQSVSLDGSASNADSYIWTNSNNEIIGTSAVISVSVAGCYTLTMTQQDCQNTTQVCVEDQSVAVSPAQISGDISVCAGEEVTYQTVIDPNADSYIWTIPANAEVIGAANEASISVIWTDGQGGELCVAAQNACGIGENDCLNVSMNTPTATISGETTICDSGILELHLSMTGEAPFAVVLNGETLENLPAEYDHQVEVNSTTVFTIESITDAGSCSTDLFESLTVTVNNSPVIELPASTNICNTAEASDVHILNFESLLTDNTISGTWEDTDISGATGVFPNLDFYDVTPGTYTFTFTTDNALEPCENSSASIEVIVENCTCPDASFTDIDLCSNEAELDLTSLQNEDFVGMWSIINSPAGNNSAVIEGAIFNATGADLGDYTVQFILTENVPAGCETTWQAVITVLPFANAGEGTSLEYCEATEENITLFEQLSNADTGGSWTQATGEPLDNTVFDVANATLDIQNTNPGTYSFIYSQNPSSVCSSSSATVTVTVVPMPIADAGQEQSITCEQSVVTLGGADLSQGEDLTYSWYMLDAFISSEAHPEITAEGTYTLTVSNEFGCTSTSEVTITETSSAPLADVSITPISCYDEADGIIEINTVSGGVEPYMFSLDGQNFSEEMYFYDLEPSNYTLTVQDANGCQSEITFNIEQPQEAEVVLVAYLDEETVPATITLGESVDFEALINLPAEDITSVTWTNGEYLNCDTCLAVTATPIETTTFTVTIETNACADISTSIMVVVDKDYEVFVPNIFSPNNDGENDIFYIFAPDNVVKVNNFGIHSRWGETLFTRTDFVPNDPNFGWDGTHRGQAMNSGVYVWYAEIEFLDGEVIVFKGDITIAR